MDRYDQDHIIEQRLQVLRVIAALLGGIALGSMLIHWPRRAAVEDWLLQQPRLG